MIGIKPNICNMAITFQFIINCYARQVNWLLPKFYHRLILSNYIHTLFQKRANELYLTLVL